MVTQSGGKYDVAVGKRLAVSRKCRSHSDQGGWYGKIHCRGLLDGRCLLNCCCLLDCR